MQVASLGFARYCIHKNVNYANKGNRHMLLVCKMLISELSDFELARILNMFKKKRPKDTSLRQYEKSQERNRHTILCIIQDA